MVDDHGLGISFHCDLFRAAKRNEKITSPGTCRWISSLSFHSLVSENIVSQGTTPAVSETKGREEIDGQVVSWFSVRQRLLITDPDTVQETVAGTPPLIAKEKDKKSSD